MQKVSIIIPVYNVEKYLDECLNSVVNQTYKDLEIILVNDGSADDSYKICKKWKKSDKRIKLITKENEGLGYARNTGLQNCTGDYVLFLDSDDFIKLDTIEKMMNAISKNDAVFSGYINYYSKDNLKEIAPTYDNKLFNTKEKINNFLLDMVGSEPTASNDIIMPMAVTRGLYSSKIIKDNKLKFVSERELISEDIFFNIDFLKAAKSIYYLSDNLFYYRKTNENSLTTIYNPQRFEKEVVLYKKLNEKLLSYFQNDYYLLRLQRTFLGRVRSCILRAVKYKINVKTEIKKICKNSTVKEVLDNYPYKKNSFKLAIYNYCIKHKLVSLLILMSKLRQR